MKRNDIRPRDLPDPMVSEVVRSAQEVLDAIPITSHVWVRGVVASGTAGTEFARVAWGAGVPSVVVADDASGPDAAVVLRVVERGAETADPGAVGRLNHRFESSRDGRHTVVLFEPSGLTADATYDVLVHLVAGVDV